MGLRLVKCNLDNIKQIWQEIDVVMINVIRNIRKKLTGNRKVTAKLEIVRKLMQKITWDGINKKGRARSKKLR